MAERSDRLDLIARAASRLEGAENAVASQHAATDRIPVIQQGASAFPQRETTVPRAVESPFHGTSPRGQNAVGRSVRLNFAELRKLGIVTPDAMSSGISFEFRAIKRKLLAATRGQDGGGVIRNLVMITSALPGEGKTFTSANLAFALAAERDLKVLLIDADVIKPSVGKFFEGPDKAGLTNFLNGSCNDIGDVMHRCSDIPNLTVIFAGERDERSPELMSSRRTKEMCIELSRRYTDRIVIFDTPPLLAAAEPAALATHVDQVIMVVAAGASNHSQLQTALDNVSGCPNVSIVFNKAPRWHKVEAESYYYYYGRTAGSSNERAETV